uniref:Uncharacterized protein n=1 Tax=Molossus molossus TaxID=27622 RepID=A0A7J8I934_MOLMO|nr:hypothetical protein HJG59_010541 [Molossus molossus]
MKWQQILIYQELNLKNKINKQNRNRPIDTENILMVATWYREHFDGCHMVRGLEEWVRKVNGLKYTLVVTEQSWKQYSTVNVVNDTLITMHRTDGCKVYLDDHLVSYAMSNHCGVHKKNYF